MGVTRPIFSVWIIPSCFPDKGKIFPNSLGEEFCIISFPILELIGYSSTLVPDPKVKFVSEVLSVVNGKSVLIFWVEKVLLIGVEVISGILKFPVSILVKGWNILFSIFKFWVSGINIPVSV